MFERLMKVPFFLFILIIIYFSSSIINFSVQMDQLNFGNRYFLANLQLYFLLTCQFFSELLYKMSKIGKSTEEGAVCSVEVPNDLLDLWYEQIKEQWRIYR